MISELEARQYVLERCTVTDVVESSLAEADGAVLAESVVAQEDVPPFANSASDPDSRSSLRDQVLAALGRVVDTQGFGIPTKAKDPQSGAAFIDFIGSSPGDTD